MRPLPFFEILTPPSPTPRGQWTPQWGKGHVGRHCPYTYTILCGFVHALLRYRSKTTKIKKYPIDSYSNENFISPFPLGATNPKRGEDTSGTRIRPHANIGVNRPAGYREIVDRTKTRGQSNLTKSAIPRLGVTPGGRKLYH